jgi:hypothetical protein
VVKRSKSTEGVPANPGRLGPTVESADRPPAAISAEAGQEARGRGRRTGKRSDPAFRATTFFVRKETKRRASRLLEDQETGKDLSDLIEELLAQWVVEHSNA